MRTVFKPKDHMLFADMFIGFFAFELDLSIIEVRFEIRFFYKQHKKTEKALKKNLHRAPLKSK